MMNNVMDNNNKEVVVLAVVEDFQVFQERDNHFS